MQNNNLALITKTFVTCPGEAEAVPGVLVAGQFVIESRRQASHSNSIALREAGAIVVAWTGQSVPPYFAP
jgi:hypothetical protein